MMLRAIAQVLLVSLAVPVVMGATAPAQFGMFKKNKDPEYKPFQAPSQRFTVDYPSHDWDVRPGGTGTVVFTQKKGEAAVTIEYETLERALTPSDISDQAAQYEIDRIKRQLPKAEGFKSQIRDTDPRRPIVIDYRRPAIPSGVEQARQYSIIHGRDLYRLICSASTGFFAKYEPVFNHVVESFKIAATP